MSLYLGPLYFEEKDLFLLLALGLLIGGWLGNLPLPFVAYPSLIVLILLFLVAKALIVKTHSSLVYSVFLLAFILSNVFSLQIVILFVLFSFLFLKVFKVI